MTTIHSFVSRLGKLGIKVELFGNYPWVYLNRINGQKVEGCFQSEHGFTIFYRPLYPGNPDRITDIPVIFNKIRETLNK